MSNPERDIPTIEIGGHQQTPPDEAQPQLHPVRSSKIQARHLERLAIVYIRQSTPHQVLDHRESRERQYALADYAVALGWPRDRVLVIDEDQGHSGKTAEGRHGFHRVFAELTLDHAGVILGLEMSRLARSNKDWHHLLEACSVFGALLGDQDGIYEPRDSNDRLLLGLKGTMSEFELVTMRNRLNRGILNKAERGELFTGVPAGYVKLPTGRVIQDPDEQVRAVVALIFDKFEELGTIRAVFRYLISNKICIGGRARCGPKRGQLEWRRPSLGTLSQMLHHPIYAGAYAFGCRVADPKRRGRGNRAASRRVPMEQWKVLKRDILPAYISWERYLANQRRLKENRPGSQSVGSARCGVALLSGLVICGNCGLRLHTQYPRTGNAASYYCRRHLVHATEKTCYGVMATAVDALVAQQVLQALEPARLELCLQAAQDIQKERDRLARHWQQRLDRARYEAELVQRRYNMVEPENRLVARTLEQHWEEALRQQRQLEEEYDRFRQTQPLELSEVEQQRIRSLSADVAGLWQAEGTTAVDRKEIVRSVVERVVVQVRPASHRVGVSIHWKGGSISTHEIVRSVCGYEQMDTFEQLMARIRQLREEDQTAARIAEKLNDEGFRTPRQSRKFNRTTVLKLLSRTGIFSKRTYKCKISSNEWRLSDLSRELKMSPSKLRAWMLRGWVHGRQIAGRRWWILWADDDELTRLRKLKDRSFRGVESYPEELTRPKERPER
jgi:DNA invertase Pin-like site-specific DNA recombinase